MRFEQKRGLVYKSGGQLSLLTYFRPSYQETDKDKWMFCALLFHNKLIDYIKITLSTWCASSRDQSSVEVKDSVSYNPGKEEMFQLQSFTCCSDPSKISAAVFEGLSLTSSSKHRMKIEMKLFVF